MMATDKDTTMAIILVVAVERRMAVIKTRIASVLCLTLSLVIGTLTVTAGQSVLTGDTTYKDISVFLVFVVLVLALAFVGIILPERKKDA